jgi:hypothetical protein
VSEQQEALTMTGQYLVGKKQNGTPYIWRNNSAQDIFVPAQWAAAKESVEVKGMTFVGVVHCFQNNATLELSAVANTDTPTPSDEEKKWLDDIMLDLRYMDLFVANIEHSKVAEMLYLYPLECKDCLEGRPLCLNGKR